MDNKLLYGVMQTITYYDVMDYPLTDFEVWRHLIVQDSCAVWSLGDVRRVLMSQSVRSYVAECRGFYFLHGREHLVFERLKRQRISLLKIKRLRRYVFWLRCVPFVRMIALTGRLSFRNGTDQSDLDLLVVARSGHIWMCRMLFTCMTHVMGVRRYGDKCTNRICLNYYITDTSLEIPTKDLFGAHEYSFITPLFGGDVFKDFVLANRWIRKYKPHYIVDVLDGTWLLQDSFLWKNIRIFGEFVFGGSFLEDRVRRFQYKKIMENPNTNLAGALIIANDNHLVFLPKPHGPHVYEEYRKRFDALELPWSTT